jgi:hypothetical protein
MRLVNTETYLLSDHSVDQIPPFAILSHRWGDDEVSYHDYVKRRVTIGTGFQKIVDFCNFAKSQLEAHEWVWVDSCCIDKKSSSELTEAINSMYTWYKKATVCYAYMRDVKTEGKRKRDEPDGFQQSEWFTRGWTLQELLAPSRVTFCDKDWKIVGTKTDLATSIQQASGIPEPFLTGQRQPQEASVAMRMSWISRRTTTKPEDIAYCILGLFNVNMPLLYGEGNKAFVRLQQEIIKYSDDESIFAWTSDTSTWGMLAPSHESFQGSANVVNIRLTPEERMPFFMTNKGLQFHSSSDTEALDKVDPSTRLPMGYPDHTVQLGCFFGQRAGMTDEDFDAEEMWEEGALTIELERVGPVWLRVDCARLGRANNVQRPKRKNGTYEGRGVQRVYIVQQPDL